MAVATMRAARFTGAGRPLAVQEVPRPAPGPGEVLVRVGAAGVCGTELHFLDGLLTPARTPITLGHEVAGTVTETGPGADGALVGSDVAVHYLHPCRRCRACRTGAEHLCEAPTGFLAFVDDGGFAEYLTVPATAVVPLPTGLSPAQAAPLCCGATTALHARAVAGLAPGQSAAVVGCGGVGLALVQVLALAGVRTVAVSRDPARRDLAVELGAEAAVATGDVDGLRAATGGRGADAVFDTAGTAATMRDGVAGLARGGALVLIGYSADRLELHPLDLVVPELRVLTSVSNTHPELVEALDLAARGLLRAVVAETAPLEEVNRVLDDLRAGRLAGRAVLVPGQVTSGVSGGPA